jgi:hypothetical protein
MPGSGRQRSYRLAIETPPGAVGDLIRSKQIASLEMIIDPCQRMMKSHSYRKPDCV